ncbi:MAG: TrmH family RNA methyltransferase [Patescibacteria group bacterium]
MSIFSPKNPKIKNIIKLYKKRERNKSGLFIIEGYREISRALENKLTIESLYLCPNFFSKNKSNPLPSKTYHPEPKTHYLTPQLFTKISYREHPDGHLAIFRQPNTQLPDNLFLEPKTSQPKPSTPLFLILESPEKPGNLGAILRTADATQVNAIIICDPKLDLFNPNVIRSACGTFFSRPIYLAPSTETIEQLKKNQIQIISTTPHTDKYYYEIDFIKPSAIIIGTEHEGLSPLWLKNSTHKTKIPMLGQADSLNLSVSSAIILYEALRQRR